MAGRWFTISIPGNTSFVPNSLITQILWIELVCAFLIFLWIEFSQGDGNFCQTPLYVSQQTDMAKSSPTHYLQESHIDG